MIYIINFIIKIIGTILWLFEDIFAIMISILFWDSRYLESSHELLNLIWKKNQ